MGWDGLYLDEVEALLEMDGWNETRLDVLRLDEVCVLL